MGFHTEFHSLVSRLGVEDSVLDLKGLESFMRLPKQKKYIDTDFKAAKQALFLEVFSKELLRLKRLVKSKAELAKKRWTTALKESVDDNNIGTVTSQDLEILKSQISKLYDDVMLVSLFLAINLAAVEYLSTTKHCPTLRSKADSLFSLFTQLVQLKIDIYSTYERLRLGRTLFHEFDDDLRLFIKKYFTNQYHVASAKPVIGTVVTGEKKTKSTARSKGIRIPNQDVSLLWEFSIGRLAGQGAFGAVFSAVSKISKRKTAIKWVPQPWESAVYAQRIYREVAVLSSVVHPNIISLLQVHGLLQPVHKSFLMYELLQGLNYLHSAGIIHRDLKPSNLLIDSSIPRMYISDFGSARTLVDGATRESFQDSPGYVQTQWYRSPEVLLCASEVGTAADMWSFGCVLAELITGVPVLPGIDTRHQLELVISCTGQPMPEEIEELKSSTAEKVLTQELGYQANNSNTQEFLLPSRTVRNLLEEVTPPVAEQEIVEELIGLCLVFSPSSRISAASALSHSWFSSFPLPKSIFRSEPLSLACNCASLHSIKTYKQELNKISKSLNRVASLKSMPRRAVRKVHDDPSCMCLVS